MKFYYRYILFCLSLISLTGAAQTSFDYEIKGEIKGLGNDTLYLTIMGGRESKQQENIRIPASGDKFFYKGKADQPSIVWAQTTAKRGNNGNFTLFIEKGKIKIEGNNTDLTRTKISGTAGNIDHSFVLETTNTYYDRIKVFQKTLKENGDSSSAVYKNTFKQIALLYDSITFFEAEFVRTHPNSLASGMALLLIADKIPVQKLEEFYINFSEDVKQLGILAKLPGRIEAKKRSIIGSAAPDFVMNDMYGKPVKLSDYKGKYVLLDFWASWCIPCRKDNPYVKAAYEKFKDKNFVVIGVSVDEDGNKWKQAIEKDQLPWKHISDLQKINKVAELYGVQPIPDNFLIDPNGKIIERGLHGETLEKTLEGIIK